VGLSAIVLNVVGSAFSSRCSNVNTYFAFHNVYAKFMFS
jgi:hypothetical protein